MTKTKNDLLLQHLLHMLSNHEYNFEESLAQFMLMSLGKDFLKGAVVKGIEASNYNIQTSLYGYINMKFIDSCTHPFADSYYETNGDFGQKYKKSAQEKAIIGQKNLDVWSKLLSDISPELINDKTCTLSKWGNIEEVGFNLWYILYRPNEWATNYIKNPEQWKISPKEEKIFANALLHPDQRFNLSSLNMYQQAEEVSVLLNIFLKHSQSLKSEFLNSKITLGLTVQDWIDKLFNSSSMKALIEQGDLKDVSQLFDDDSLKSLLKKTNLKNNVEKYPEMLANILPIAPAEKWVNSCMVKGKFHINTFFDNKFIRGYGRSLTKDLNKPNSRYGGAQKALDQEFSYFSEFLNSNYVKNEDLIQFWNHVIKIQEFDLLKSCSKYIGLPDINENADNKAFHTKFDNLKQDFYQNGKLESISVKEFYMSERLNNSLQEKEQPAIRKIKI